MRKPRLQLSILRTEPSARTISIDPKTDRIFLVAAEVISDPTDTATGHHAVYAPGSMKLLYLDPSASLPSRTEQVGNSLPSDARR
jgi:hypothetical protein